MIVAVRFGPEIFFALEMKGPISYARTFECTGLMIVFECTMFLSRLYEMGSDCQLKNLSSNGIVLK